MAIKRTKQATGESKKAAGTDAPAKKPAKKPVVEKTWTEQIEGKKDEAFTPYALATTFRKGQLVMHAKFGKGAISTVEGTRIEILFEDGMKKLGHATVATA